MCFYTLACVSYFSQCEITRFPAFQIKYIWRVNNRSSKLALKPVRMAAVTAEDLKLELETFDIGCEEDSVLDRSEETQI